MFSSYNIKRLDVAGRDLTNLLLKSLMERSPLLQREVVQDNTNEKLCYIEEELRVTTALRTRSSSLEKNYESPDG